MQTRLVGLGYFAMGKLLFWLCVGYVVYLIVHLGWHFTFAAARVVGAVVDVGTVVAVGALANMLTNK
jgi:hypothetical protein